MTTRSWGTLAEVFRTAHAVGATSLLLSAMGSLRSPPSSWEALVLCSPLCPEPWGQCLAQNKCTIIMCGVNKQVSVTVADQVTQSSVVLRA